MQSASRESTFATGFGVAEKKNDIKNNNINNNNNKQPKQKTCLPWLVIKSVLKQTIR